MKEKKKIIKILLLFFIIYLGINLSFKGSGYSDQYNVLVPIASLLFGIFIAFSIYNHQTKLSTIKQLLRTNDAYIISIYQHSKVFGEEISNKILELIDQYLISQIDFKLVDFYQSDKYFMELYSYIIAIKPSDDRENSAYLN